MNLRGHSKPPALADAAKYADCLHTQRNSILDAIGIIYFSHANTNDGNSIVAYFQSNNPLVLVIRTQKEVRPRHTN